MPARRKTCILCGDPVTQPAGPGRPRKYCPDCARRAQKAVTARWARQTRRVEGGKTWLRKGLPPELATVLEQGEVEEHRRKAS